MAKYSWDGNKNDANKKKHGISFEKAKEVFDDEYRIEYPGTLNTGNETRALTVGKVMGRFIIAVVYTIRDAYIRIISARQARKEEIKDYIRKKFEHSKNE